MAASTPLAVSLPADLASEVERAVEGGDYASTSEVVREALHDWQAKRLAQADAVQALRADVQRGLADIVAGRVEPFDTARIVERGRQRSATRPASS